MHDAPSFSRRRIAGAAAALAALALGAPAVAQADSIAYIKAGNVFLATTDGAREYQVTFDGGYSTVSQADNGRMVALRGDHIRHLERDGRVIADIATPVSTTTDPTMQFKGPFDPAISPDGTRVAYTYYWQYKTYGPGLPAALLHVDAALPRHGLHGPEPPDGVGRAGLQAPLGLDRRQLGRQRHGPAHRPVHPAERGHGPVVAERARTTAGSSAGSRITRSTARSRTRPCRGTSRRSRRVVDDGQRISIGNTVGGFYPDYPERCAMAQDEDANTLLSSPTFAGRRLEALLGGEHDRHPHGDAAEVHGQGRVPAVHRRRQAARSRAPRTRTGARPTCRRPVPRRRIPARSRGRTTRCPATDPGTTRPAARRSS